jgi:hypothetical protein
MSSKNVDFYEALVKELSKLNPRLTFKVCDYYENTYPKSIDVMGTAGPMEESVELPKGFRWYNDVYIMTSDGRSVKMTPYS